MLPDFCVLDGITYVNSTGCVDGY